MITSYVQHIPLQPSFLKEQPTLTIKSVSPTFLTNRPEVLLPLPSKCWGQSSLKISTATSEGHMPTLSFLHLTLSNF